MCKYTVLVCGRCTDAENESRTRELVSECKDTIHDPTKANTDEKIGDCGQHDTPSLTSGFSCSDTSSSSDERR